MNDPNPSNNSNNEMDIITSSASLSRRRFSGKGRMDPSSAMHRLRVSMVGSSGSPVAGDGVHNDNDKENIFSVDLPYAPHLSVDVLSNTSTCSDDPLGGQSFDEQVPYTTGKSLTSTPLWSEGWILRALGQIPAIALIGIFHLMFGVPIGVSYFPMQWTSRGESDNNSSSSTTMETDFLPDGEFPIPGKEAFGIRLFLFSTMIGQIIYTLTSGFPNPIGLQMVENIGFTKELAAVAIAHQGYGLDALATLMVMFGLASVLVGLVFYLLGRFQLGKIVYFFPIHVLVGLIGGIGIILVKTGLEVTIADTLSILNIIHSWRLWIVIVGLEVLLRCLEWITKDSKGNPRFALLSPVFFCVITPFFYLVLWIFGIPVAVADDAGYFFPPMVHDSNESGSGSGTGFGTPWDVWTVSHHAVL